VAVRDHGCRCDGIADRCCKPQGAVDYAGRTTALFVEVTDARLDVRFVPRAGSEKPVINALRVTHSPDR
jgi:hypothetical protein